MCLTLFAARYCLNSYAINYGPMSDTNSNIKKIPLKTLRELGMS